MFVILVYDINHKRVSKIMKICRKYLLSVQMSVFEGDLTEKKLNALKNELKVKLHTDEDAVCIYTFESRKYAHKEQIGVNMVHSNII